MSDNEPGIIDGFNDFMRDFAVTQDQKYGRYALAGQDRYTADYLLSAQNRYSLVEFKYSEDSLTAENRKPRRLNLCRELGKEDGDTPEMAVLHDLCHFICWDDIQTDLGVMCNIYRNEICNGQMWKSERDHGLATLKPKTSTRMNAEQFAQEFFHASSKRSLDLAAFKIYVAWLFKIGGGSSASLEVVVRDPQRAGVHFKRFSSLDDLHRWVNTPISPKPISSTTSTPSTQPITWTPSSSETEGDSPDEDETSNTPTNKP